MGVSNIKNGSIYPTKNFGDVEVIEYIDKYNIIIKFLNTSAIIKVSASGLRKGHSVDYAAPTCVGVGYIGYGRHSTRNPDGKRKTRAYEYWSRMLKRCYDKESQDYKDYGGKGVTVCEEWHNFQNFAEWFYNQPNNDRVGYHLDKDIWIVGNQIYCPDACNLLPPCINTLGVFRRAEKFGITSSGKWRHRIYATGKASTSYATKEECEKAYIADKRKGMLGKVEDQYSLGNITKVMYEHLVMLIYTNYPEA